MDINPVKHKIIEITEYQDKLFTHQEIPESVGQELYDKYQTQIEIEFPSYKTDNCDRTRVHIRFRWGRLNYK